VAAAGGHLGATVLHEDGTVDYTVLYSFSDRAALDAWLDSPSRRRFAAQAEPFSVARQRIASHHGTRDLVQAAARATRGSRSPRS
jgi:antibiotic biosynthesis monooxygenase (ABM) superfamily enzyme